MGEAFFRWGSEKQVHEGENRYNFVDSCKVQKNLGLYDTGILLLGFELKCLSRLSRGFALSKQNS